jgi:hypothetical protein
MSAELNDAEQVYRVLHPDAGPWGGCDDRERVEQICALIASARVAAMDLALSTVQQAVTAMLDSFRKEVGS